MINGDDDNYCAEKLEWRSERLAFSILHTLYQNTQHTSQSLVNW